MKKLIFFASFFLSAISWAMDCEKCKKFSFPSESVINERLNEMGMNFLAEQTRLASCLADQQLSPMKAVKIIDSYLLRYQLSLQARYGDEYKQGGAWWVKQVKSKKPILYWAILKDHPEAIKVLESRGFTVAQPL